eukprot:4119440-Alexandrium_andersonii.AAC.1
MAHTTALERARAQRALRRYEELHPHLGPVALACSAAEAAESEMQLLERECESRGIRHRDIARAADRLGYGYLEDA